MAKASFSTLFAVDNGVLAGFTFANEAMAEAVKKAKEVKQMRTAESAATLLSDLDKYNNMLLANLRNMRKMEKDAKDKLEKFKVATQHFLDTGNFGPLYPYMPCDVQRVCQGLGVDLPTKEEQELPKS